MYMYIYIYIYIYTYIHKNNVKDDNIYMVPLLILH